MICCLAKHVTCLSRDFHADDTTGCAHGVNKYLTTTIWGDFFYPAKKVCGLETLLSISQECLEEELPTF